MKLKSYFAATVETAMSMARQELGPDALLVVSRRAGAEARHLGEYEVVFALIPEAEAPDIPPQPLREPLKTETPAPLPLDRLSEQVSGLKHEMERLASAIARSHAAMARLASNPDAALAFSRLMESELDPEIAYEIVSRICGRADLEAPPSPGGLTARLLEAELERLVQVAPAFTGTANSVITLVGPPGSGKTTSLVKLAVRYGLGARRPAQILTLDSQRVAAAEQLRSYAAILGVGLQVLDTAAALAQALEEHRNKQLILIDTPGFAHRDLEDARDLAEFLCSRTTIQTHLVLSASTKPADMRRLAADYAMFSPSGLLFTHLDETSTFGPLLSLSLRLGKPISFLSFGQQIPEDLEPAECSAVARLIAGNAAANPLARGAKAA